MISVAVVVVVVVILLSGHGARTAPQLGAPVVPGVLPVGQARGGVVPGSMHTVGSAADSGNVAIAFERFRTTDGQLCVQLGRIVGSRVGVVGVDGSFGDDGRFHPYANGVAVDAQCVTPPHREGILLLAAREIYASGVATTRDGGCAVGEAGPAHSRCPRRDLRQVLYGLFGDDAGPPWFGTLDHQNQGVEQVHNGAGISVAAVDAQGCLNGETTCSSPFPAVSELVHPGASASTLYYGGSRNRARSCTVRGPGTDGIIAGPCRYGYGADPLRYRLTQAQVATHASVSTRRDGRQLAVTVRFRTRVSSSRIGTYELALDAPAAGCGGSSGSSSSGTVPLPAFSAGEELTISQDTALCPAAGTGELIVQPLNGHPIVAARFRTPPPQ